MYLRFNFVKIHPVVFEIPCAKDFLQKIKKLYEIKKFVFRKETKNILAILFLHILHLSNFIKLALITTEI